MLIHSAICSMPHSPTKTGMRAGSIPVIHHRCFEEQLQPAFWNQQTLMRLSPLFFVVSWLEYNRLPVCANMPQGCVTKGNHCFKPSQHFQEPAGDKSGRVKWRGWILFWIFSPPWPLLPAWAGRRPGVSLGQICFQTGPPPYYDVQRSDSADLSW